MNIFKLIINIQKFITQTVSPLSSVDMSLMNHLQLLKPIEASAEQILERCQAFIANEVPMLQFKVTSSTGVYIYFYRKNIGIINGDLKFLAPSAVAIYHRGRYPGEKNPQMKLISHLGNSIDVKLSRHLNAYKQLKDKCAGKDPCNKIPTLEKFLTHYESITYIDNPETVDRKINLIRSKFAHLLSYPLDEIKGKQLIDFVTKHKRKRTRTQIQNNESPYTVAEATIKYWVTTLRGALRAAETYLGNFECCPSLWNDKLKFKIDNESDRYLTEEELEILITSLRKRDQQKLNGKQSKCPFADYLAPLILTCLATGLRPKYALALKWSDIDIENESVRINGTKGKIRTTEYCPLTKDLLDLLTEWKKHACHKSSGDWLFPSSVKAGCHIVSYKTAFTNLRKNSGLDFVLYDTRHTFATLLTKIYKDIKTTQEMLHHKDGKSTKRYARVLNSVKTEAAAQFAAHNPLFGHYSTVPEHATQL